MRPVFLILLALCLYRPPTSLSSTSHECPRDMVLARAGVCIDRYEWPNQRGQKPLLAVSGIAETEDLEAERVLDAERLCASVGKRVCYDDEWRDACKGPHAARFPFGSTLPEFVPGDGSGLCNYDKLYRGPVDERKVFLRDEHELERLNQSEPAGARPECTSAAGAVDMMGNAEEWVRRRDGSYALAGRYWSEPWSCNSLAVGHAPNWHYYQSGVRCCLDLEDK